MIDNIVRCAQKLFGGDILINKVTRGQNVNQGYDCILYKYLKKNHFEDDNNDKKCNLKGISIKNHD